MNARLNEKESPHMERTIIRRRLPSCRVSKNLIKRLEGYLLTQIPKILKDDITRMASAFGKRSEDLWSSSLSVQEGKEVQELAGIADYQGEHFDRRIEQATLHYKVGIPVILEVTIRFSRGASPLVEIATTHRATKKLCAHIISNIQGIVQNWGNKNWLLHNRGVQVVTAVSLPVAVVLYGYLTGANMFFMVASQGWLFLLGIFLNLNLKHLFPLVSFQTRRRFNMRTLLYTFSLAGILSLIGGYIAMLSFELSLAL